MKAITILMTLGALALSFPSSVRCEEADLVISHVKVFSPPTAVINDATVVIKDGRISYVGSQAFAGTAKQSINALGKTLIPGLIDTHVHLFVGADSDEAYWKSIRDRAPAKLYDFLAHGVTTILSVGDYYPQILKVKEDVSNGTLRGPRLLVAGPMIAPSNGHPTDIMECVNNPYCRSHWAMQVDDVASARAGVRELAAKKVDLIKIAYDSRIHGNPTKQGGVGQQMGHFSPAVVKALIDEAHAQGLRAAVYATPVENAISAIEWGADLMTHGPLVIHMRPDGEVIDWPDERLKRFTALAAQKKIPVSTSIATVTINADLWGTPRLLESGTIISDWPKSLQDMVASLYQQSLADVRIMNEEGVLLAFGTDSYRIMPGESLRHEISSLREAGLSPRQIITLATKNAAVFIGRDNELGSIKRGMIADVVLLAGDPELNIAALERVDAVFVAGKAVYNFYE